MTGEKTDIVKHVLMLEYNYPAYPPSLARAELGLYIFQVFHYAVPRMSWRMSGVLMINSYVCKLFMFELSYPDTAERDKSELEVEVKILVT
jgi:hypothetical protein